MTRNEEQGKMRDEKFLNMDLSSNLAIGYHPCSSNLTSKRVSGKRDSVSSKASGKFMFWDGFWKQSKAKPQIRSTLCISPRTVQTI